MIKERPTQIAILGVVLTTIGIFSPILYNELTDKSELEIKQENSVTIINKPAEVQDLEIFYKKESITNLNKLILRITNKSNIAVIKSDFISPLNIALSKETRIISFEKEEKFPTNLFFEANIDSTRHSVNVDFALLNPKDYLVISILYTGKESDVEVQARIKGIRNVVFFKMENQKGHFIVPIIILTFILMSITFLHWFAAEKKASMRSLIKLDRDKQEGINYTKENLIRNLASIFPAYPQSSIDEIKIKILQMLNEDNENNTSLALIYINQELSKSVRINRNAEIIIRIIQIIGIAYLFVWLISNDNNWISEFFKK